MNMLALQQAPTTPTTTEPVSDARQEVNAIDEGFASDGLPFNSDGTWRALLSPKNQDVKGDALILLVTLASLEKHQGQGVRVSHAQLAKRATSIKRFLRLADQIGFQEIMNMLSITK
jgi:hypothetical protein